jgi:methylthioribulose-1-phosphate dehydratase
MQTMHTRLVGRSRKGRRHVSRIKPTLPAIARAFHEIGRDFHTRGWALGTSGNFSSVVSRNPLKLAITASAVSKGAIRPRDVLEVGADGVPVGKAGRRPSAETALHIAVARTRNAGAVLHTHSVWSTMLSELHGSKRGVDLSGFEMLKGLEGVRTHQHTEWVPIFDNDQNIPALAGRVEAMLDQSPAVHGFLLRGHGLYTWGDDLAQARRHVEIFEFLLEISGRMQTLTAMRAGGVHGSDQNC